MCPPEMWPVTDTITASTMPCARATPTRPAGSDPRRITTEPAPMKTKASVPMNSAAARCQIRSTIPPRLVRSRPNALPPARRAAYPGGRSMSRSRGGPTARISRVKVLLVSPNPDTRELMGLAVAGISRALGEGIDFLEAENGERGLTLAWRERPEVVVAEEIASRAGAFAMAKDLRGQSQPIPGVIVILLDRPHDSWL